MGSSGAGNEEVDAVNEFVKVDNRPGNDVATVIFSHCEGVKVEEPCSKKKTK